MFLFVRKGFRLTTLPPTYEEYEGITQPVPEVPAAHWPDCLPFFFILEGFPVGVNIIVFTAIHSICNALEVILYVSP